MLLFSLTGGEVEVLKFDSHKNTSFDLRGNNAQLELTM
jgi:hypothetical protein